MQLYQDLGVLIEGIENELFTLMSERITTLWLISSGEDKSKQTRKSESNIKVLKLFAH